MVYIQIFNYTLLFILILVLNTTLFFFASLPDAICCHLTELFASLPDALCCYLIKLFASLPDAVLSFDQVVCLPARCPVLSFDQVVCLLARCPVLLVAGQKSVFNQTTKSFHQSLVKQCADKGRVEFISIDGVANILEEAVSAGSVRSRR